MVRLNWQPATWAVSKQVRASCYFRCRLNFLGCSLGLKLGQVTVIRILFHRHLEPIAGFHKGKNDINHNDNNDKLTYRQTSETLGSIADHHSKANIAQNF